MSNPDRHQDPAESAYRHKGNLRFQRRNFAKLACCATFVGAFGSRLRQAEATPSVFPTGVTIHDPDLAYKCLIVFSTPDGKTRVIDMQGNEVHRWNYYGFPGRIIDPALVGEKLGHTLLQIEASHDKTGGILSNKVIGELDWAGRIVWHWGTQAPGGAAYQNHDWARLANGNTLLLTARPRTIKSIGSKEVIDQGIYEVDPSGKLVWQWWAGDHLEEFGLSAKGWTFLRNKVAAETEMNPWGYLEINDMRPLGPNKWFDGGDHRFAPDNIMIDSRKANFIVIISKKTGKVVWRMGPYYRNGFYDPDERADNSRLPRPVDQLAGQHNAHIIPKGLPGAGNLLLLDDQGGSGYPPVLISKYSGSRVLEINPVRGKIVWEYTAINSGQPPWSFYTSFIGNAQRLPNGNTLIDEGMDGRIFQITPTGKIVWEYVSPYSGSWLFGGRKVAVRAVYRAQAVPFSWVPAGVTPA
ncbi:aryl-sulfate sulfotransferase [Acidiphilium sp. AL]|uniref:Aryl-sulfate sulfotransferase n=1 Tax=Acidiphilium iwatense TaxID=768198 RepID=A0ABS9DY29_9PROT|nr:MULTISPECIES: aryl-sulfate sulfotransferase [Acidiphilium]MCF3947090.1 aryl-sulfate sulfotransferase [Acidiphilium iwatense]MCU4160492.1 aryl-sulfate sulfotransferase [Acidiphilium sp. AL]